MGRKPCCAKEGLNRGAWTVKEDKILTNYVNIHGEGKWTGLPQRAGLKRCGKSCRLRWLNYLRPDIKRGNISVDEEELIIKLHKLLGNRWSLIAGRLPGRTDNEIKNYWNTKLSKKMPGHKAKNCTKNQNKLSENETVHRLKVIRPKAVRFTKDVISRQLGNQQFVKKNEEVVPNWDHESPSSPLADHHPNVSSSNYLADFNISDLFMSDVNGGDCNGMIMSSSCDFVDPTAYEALKSNNISGTTDKIMIDCWKASSSNNTDLQQFEALELKKLASFFDSEEEWIQ